MSRFDSGRWNRILIWTGAALAWATAFVVWLEPTSGGDGLQPPSPAGDVSESSLQANMPRPTPQGLVILRLASVDTPAPNVVTVGVARGAGSSAPAAPQAASTQPAPAPESSGS